MLHHTKLLSNILSDCCNSGLPCYAETESHTSRRVLQTGRTWARLWMSCWTSSWREWNAAWTSPGSLTAPCAQTATAPQTSWNQRTLRRANVPVKRPNHNHLSCLPFLSPDWTHMWEELPCYFINMDKGMFENIRGWSMHLMATAIILLSPIHTVCYTTALWFYKWLLYCSLDAVYSSQSKVSF